MCDSTSIVIDVLITWSILSTCMCTEYSVDYILGCINSLGNDVEFYNTLCIFNLVLLIKTRQWVAVDAEIQILSAENALLSGVASFCAWCAFSCIHTVRSTMSLG